MALSQREKILLVVPVALGGLLGVFYWVHEPLSVRRAAAQELSGKVHNELTRDQAKLSREGDIKSRKEAVAARERVVDAWVPGKNSAALFIWYLSQAEARSGASIKSIQVGERKVVTVAPEQGQQQAPPAGQQQTPKAAQPEGGAAPTLAVIQLNLKVDARFAEHLLFNQALEEMPLFLNTGALSLARGDKLPTDRVTKLLEQGNTWLATQILSASPPLDGTYQVNLYFKGGKAGPTTEPMQFAEQTGRMDPFVMTGVDEFIRLLLDHYTDQKGLDDGAAPGSGRNTQDGPGGRSGQLG